MHGQVSVHELATANKHADSKKIHAAPAEVINAFARLDLARLWGDGSRAGVGGTQIDTWGGNLLAETSIRYGGYGGIACRLISGTYTALFSHFIS
jgi:TnpA family transposase